jgi:zinc D-Ala-D-Ala carboxypeptidase
MQPNFLELLEKARVLAAIPFKISSGFRCFKNNSKVGGVSDSAHQRGLATDIAAIQSSTRAKIVQAAILAGFQRIGIDQRFVHLDMDLEKPYPVIWLY